MEERVFLLGGLDREIGAVPSGVIAEMRKLLSLLQAAAAPVLPIEAAPIYALGGLELALRDAVDSFLRPWEARLGLAYRDGIRAEHHTRVRALTRRQHYVPDFYLSQWNDAKGHITCHDILKVTTFACDPANTLVQGYFYEEDPSQPDNRIENILAAMEGVCSVTFKKLFVQGAVAAATTDLRKQVSALQRLITEEDADNLSQFAAYQYMRVPGAIAQKAYELQPSDVPEYERTHALNPGRFVESGYRYVAGRFKGMKLMILVSPGREFITSDWPCFDMKDSPDSPLLGEEIGRNPGVVCYLPLAPRFGAVFFTPEFSANASLTPRVVVSPQSDGTVKNQNTLVIQKAERFVVAFKPEPYIFRIAARRKKAHPPA
jgi:hypothetical protein